MPEEPDIFEKLQLEIACANTRKRRADCLSKVIQLTETYTPLKIGTEFGLPMEGDKKSGNVLIDIVNDLRAKFPPLLETATEKAPEGWKTESALTNELHVGHNAIKTLVNGFRLKYSQLIQPYLDGISRPREHYAPALIELIRRELEKVPKAKKEEVTRGRLAEILHVGGTTVEKVAKKHIRSHRKWAQPKKTTGNVTCIHYTSRLAKIVKKEIRSRKKRPNPQWETRRAVAIRLSIDEKTVTKLVRRFNKKGRKWFRKYLTDDGNSYFHLSPALAKLIEKWTEDYPKAPEGWMVNRQLAQLLGVRKQKVKKIADRYRQEFPSWFVKYRNSHNKVFEHYPPKLVELIKRELEEKAFTSPTPAPQTPS